MIMLWLAPTAVVVIAAIIWLMRPGDEFKQTRERNRSLERLGEMNPTGTRGEQERVDATGRTVIDVRPDYYD
jgi:hypothetical protein